MKENEIMIATDNILPLILLLVFVSIVLMVESLFLIWNSRRGKAATRLDQRLDPLTRQRTADASHSVMRQRKLSALSPLEGVLSAVPAAVRLEQIIEQSGLRWTVARVILSSMGIAIAGLAVCGLLAQPLYTSALVAFLLGTLPLAFVLRARRRRLRKLEMQLPGALDLITRAMRAGHSLPLGIQLLADEMPAPIAGEFRLVYEQISFGISLQQALANLCERVPLTDYRFFAVSVMIQRQSGGNLTEVLANLSRLIRERLKLLSRVKVLSSEGRLSGWILGVMPFGIGAIMNLVNPDFMSPMWKDPIGITMLQVLLTMMFFGLIVLRRIVKLRV
jgi:tight adherence protein B